MTELEVFYEAVKDISRVQTWVGSEGYPLLYDIDIGDGEYLSLSNVFVDQFTPSNPNFPVTFPVADPMAIPISALQYKEFLLKIFVK